MLEPRCAALELGGAQTRFRGYQFTFLSVVELDASDLDDDKGKP